MQYVLDVTLNQTLCCTGVFVNCQFSVSVYLFQLTSCELRYSQKEVYTSIYICAKYLCNGGINCFQYKFAYFKSLLPNSLLFSVRHGQQRSIVQAEFIERQLHISTRFTIDLSLYVLFYLTTGNSKSMHSIFSKPSKM